jgi:RimJ/RimL family protein N-acetyltransferase
MQTSYWLGEPFWGRGIASEAVSMMVNYVFSDAFSKFNKNKDVIRIEACIFEQNSVKFLSSIY